MDERIREAMDKHVEATMKHLKCEIELAFLAGVRAGLDEGKRIHDGGAHQRLEFCDYHAEAH
jgi:hypothetical protein